MNELQPNAKIISEFKGEINNCIVNDKTVYYTVIYMLSAMSNMHITFTKPKDFVCDLIKAFTELNQRHDNDRYAYLELSILDIIDEATTLEELANNLNDFIKNEYCEQLYTIYNRLIENYYTS